MTEEMIWQKSLPIIILSKNKGSEFSEINFSI